MLPISLAILSLTTPPPSALLQPLSPGAKLQQLSGLLLGSALLQDERAWGLLQTEEDKQFAEIARCSCVKPSDRHELGVFASTDLAKDSIVSFYPVHSIGLGEQRLAQNSDDTEFWKTATNAYRSMMLHAAVQEFAPGVYVDVNLHRADTAGWLAHRANDAAPCDCSNDATILDYYEQCGALCNTVLVPFGSAAPILALMTTREVRQGEELLVSYGHEAWAAQGGTGTWSPLTEA